jgi:tRNA A37 N6-isopentenylltransferase MiaA
VVLSGTNYLSGAWPRRTSPIQNVLEPIIVGALSYEDTRELMTSLDGRMDIHFQSGIVEEVFKLTGGHPYMVQAVGHLLVNHAHEINANTITLKALQTVFHEIKSYLEPIFKSTIHGLSNNQLEWLRHLSSNEALPSLSEWEVHELIAREIIREQDSTYEFPSEILKFFLKNHTV